MHIFTDFLDKIFAKQPKATVDSSIAVETASVGEQTIDEIKNIESQFMQLYGKWAEATMYMSSGITNCDEYGRMRDFAVEHKKIVTVCVRNLIARQPLHVAMLFAEMYPDVLTSENNMFTLSEYCNIWLNILEGVTDPNKFTYHYADYDDYTNYMNNHYIPWGGEGQEQTDPNPSLEEFISNKYEYVKEF